MSFILLLTTCCCFSADKPEITSITPTNNSELLQDTIEIELQYYGMMCPCPQWATPSDVNFYEQNIPNIPMDSLFLTIQATHDSIKYPFDLENWERTIDDTFKFRGQFWKHKRTWITEDGITWNNRHFVFHSCQIIEKK